MAMSGMVMVVSGAATVSVRPVASGRAGRVAVHVPSMPAVAAVAAERHRHIGAVVGSAGYAYGAVALEHGAGRIDREQTGTAAESGDTCRRLAGHEHRAGSVGMDSIVDQFGAVVEVAPEIDQLYLSHLGHTPYGGIDAVAPCLGAGAEAEVGGPQRGELRDHDTHVGIHLSIRLDEVHIVGDKFIAVVGPVTRIGVVDSEVYYRYIGLEIK